MEKRKKLRIEELAVDSFETASPSRHLGTVRAHITNETFYRATCLEQVCRTNGNSCDTACCIEDSTACQ